MMMKKRYDEYLKSAEWKNKMPFGVQQFFVPLDGDISWSTEKGRFQEIKNMRRFPNCWHKKTLP